MIKKILISFFIVFSLFLCLGVTASAVDDSDEIYINSWCEANNIPSFYDEVRSSGKHFFAFETPNGTTFNGLRYNKIWVVLLADSFIQTHWQGYTTQYDGFLYYKGGDEWVHVKSSQIWVPGVDLVSDSDVLSYLSDIDLLREHLNSDNSRYSTVEYPANFQIWKDVYWSQTDDLITGSDFSNTVINSISYSYNTLLLPFMNWLNTYNILSFIIYGLVISVVLLLFAKVIVIGR